MSIWKTPDQKPDTDQHVLFFAGGGIFPYLGFYYQKFDTFNDWESKDVQRWASVFEVIAQADKAERLQKAVDLAVETLKFYADRRHYKDEELDLSVYEWYEKEEMGVLVLDDGGRIENGKKARDTIKQQIKGE